MNKLPIGIIGCGNVLGAYRQAIDKLRLDSEEVVPGRRPKGLGMESCVGTEYVAF